MVLARVWYELFDYEAQELDSHPDASSAELGMQLRLEMTDGSRVFVAWTWGPRGDDFHVGFAPNSFCTGAPEVDRDVSAWPLWSRLIGRPITLSFTRKRQQVLEIRADGVVVYCCSYRCGLWGMDELYVSDRLPD